MGRSALTVTQAVRYLTVTCRSVTRHHDANACTIVRTSGCVIRMGGDSELDALRARLPGVRAWEGFGGNWYAWRLMTSPPDVRRHSSRGELLADLKYRAAEQARWDADHL